MLKVGPHFDSKAVSQVGLAIYTLPFLPWPHLDLAGMDGVVVGRYQSKAVLSDWSEC